jgi:hypothetical protein
VKIAKDFYVTLHGIEHSQYFQGHGLWGNRWQDCATGIGDSEKQALDDALEQLASNGWDVEGVKVDGLEKLTEFQEEHIKELIGDNEESELHYFVSVDVSEES